MAEQELKKISQAELDEILKQHELWLKSGGQNGTCADLSFHDLRQLIFPNEVNLEKAVLKGANLQNTNLERANLIQSILADADLWNAILVGADFRGADLRRVDFRHANLMYADLRMTSLKGANLGGAELSRTDIRGATGIGDTQSLHLTEDILQQQLKISQLENQLEQLQVENNQSQEQQKKVAQLEQKLELAKQQEQELQKLKTEKERLENEIKSILETNIDEAHKALTNALTNTGEQIANNQKFSTLLKWGAVVLIGLDIVFVIAIPILILCGKFNDLLDKVGIWAILFFTFPALLILLIALSLLRHQKQLIAEIRHYSMLKHKIELYGGILKAAQFTASSVMQSQNSEAAKYIQETFNEIKAELLKSPNFDLNAQPHIFPEEGGNLVEMLKSITELLKISTEANKAIAESAKKATTSEK